MSVSFSGLSSGLNTDRIISQLLRIERKPQIRYENQIDRAEEKQQAFQDLSSRLTSLLDNARSLSTESTFQQKTVSSSNTGVLTASIVDSDKVQEGTFDVFVEQLATTASVTSGQVINDQRMVDSSKNNATLISDFEQVEGSGTVDLTGTSSTAEMLDQLSKAVETSGAGNTDFRLDLDDDGDFSEADENIDLNQFDSFQGLFDAINGSAVNETGDASGKDIDGDGNNERFQFGYDSSKDKFFFQPLVSDSSGGDSLRADDVQGNISDASKGFLQQIGINEDETIHHFAQRQSDLGENLISIDPSKNLENNLFTSDLAGGTNTIRINNTELSFDPTSDSLDDVITAINDKVDGVNASYNTATDKVSLQTENSGAGSISVEDVSGNLADALNIRTENTASAGQTQAADPDGDGDPGKGGTDAVVQIDGDTVTANGNTVTFNGIELNLKELYKESNNSGEPVKVEAGKDVEGITDEVEQFVKQFNSIMEFINTRNNTNPASEPGEERGEQGVFAGDSTVRRIKNTLIQTVTSRYENATGSDVIQDAGSVGIEQKDPLTAAPPDQGKLNFDAGEFKDALAEDPDAVEDLFSADTSDGDPADGIGTELNTYIKEGLTDNLDGILPARIEGFDRTIQNLNERIQENEEHVQARREQLEQKFLQMELMLTRLSSQRSFISARL